MQEQLEQTEVTTNSVSKELVELVIAAYHRGAVDGIDNKVDFEKLLADFSPLMLKVLSNATEVVGNRLLKNLTKIV